MDQITYLSEKVRDQWCTEGGLSFLNNTIDDVMGGTQASSHDANMLLCYFSLRKNRDSPSGLAVQSSCMVPVRSTVALCKDRTRHKEFRSSGLTRNAGRRREGEERRRGT